jgi:glyoxylase-like metal-dependent hydrolase (beta-lactamase superfamily II)
MSQRIRAIRLLLPYRLGSVNSYLIETETGYVLIDTGAGDTGRLPRAWQAIPDGIVRETQPVTLLPFSCGWLAVSAGLRYNAAHDA